MRKFRYAIGLRTLYRYIGPDDVGEFWYAPAGNWLPGVKGTISVGLCVAHSLFLRITRQQAEKRWPAAFQSPTTISTSRLVVK